MERLKPKPKLRGMRGGGKPPGAISKLLPTRINRNRLAAVIEQLDTTPLEIMLGNMAFWYRRSESITDRFVKALNVVDMQDPIERRSIVGLLGDMLACREKAQECAVAAAPYVHPKQATVTVKGDKDNPIPIEIRQTMNPREAAEAYAAMLQQE